MIARRRLLGFAGGLAGAAVLPWPLAAGERERRVPLSDTQVNSRLADLDDDGLISSAVLGKTKVWYLNLSGHQAAESAGCDCGEQLFL